MDWEKETIIQLETNIDHLTGEEIGMALNFLNDLPELLDAVFIPGTGKKNRPVGILKVLCKPGDEELAVAAIFRHTHTLGLRRQEIERYILPREALPDPGAGGKHTKIYTLEGQTYLRPEADYIMREAKRQNIGAPALRIQHVKKG